MAQQGQTRRIRGFPDGLEGLAAWMMNGVELLVDCTETGSLGAPLLSNTELIKWRKVFNTHRPKQYNCERSIDTYFQK